MIKLILADIPRDRPTGICSFAYQKTPVFIIKLILADIPPDRPTEHWDLQLRLSENTNPLS
jgi:hypothetical protein